MAFLFKSWAGMGFEDSRNHIQHPVVVKGALAPHLVDRNLGFAIEPTAYRGKYPTAGYPIDWGIKVSCAFFRPKPFGSGREDRHGPPN